MDSPQSQPEAPTERPPLRVFVSSPGDVTAEREAAKAVVCDLSDGCRAATGRSLEAVTWEEQGRPGAGVDAQDVLNKDVAEAMDGCDVYVRVMWSRLGTPTQRAASGTVEEFERAYQGAKRTDFKSPRMMVYFKTAPPTIRTSADAGQYQAVLEFKESLSDGLLTWDFDDTDHPLIGIPLDFDVPRPTCDAVVDTLRARWKAFRESHSEAGATPCGIVNSLGSRMTGARLLMALLQDSAAEVRLRAAGLELAGGDHRVAPFDELRRAQGRGSP